MRTLFLGGCTTLIAIFAQVNRRLQCRLQSSVRELQPNHKMKHTTETNHHLA